MTYRVIQWATGNVGSRALKTVIEHPDYELVGLYVSSLEKAGKDAGELVGLDPVGRMRSAAHHAQERGSSKRGADAANDHSSPYSPWQPSSRDWHTANHRELEPAIRAPPEAASTDSPRLLLPCGKVRRALWRRRHAIPVWRR